MGSSPISRAGQAASALAIAIRCRWPPENSCGSRGRRSRGQPDPLQQVGGGGVVSPADATRRRSARPPGGAGSARRRDPGRPSGSRSVTGSGGAGRAGSPGAVEGDRPGCGRVEPAHRAGQSRLAAPGLADESDDLARRDVRLTPATRADQRTAAAGRGSSTTRSCDGQRRRGVIGRSGSGAGVVDVWSHAAPGRLSRRARGVRVIRARSAPGRAGPFRRRGRRSSR